MRALRSRVSWLRPAGFPSGVDLAALPRIPAQQIEWFGDRDGNERIGKTAPWRQGWVGADARCELVCLWRWFRSCTRTRTGSGALFSLVHGQCLGLHRCGGWCVYRGPRQGCPVDCGGRRNVGGGSRRAGCPAVTTAVPDRFRWTAAIRSGRQWHRTDDLRADDVDGRGAAGR